MVATFVAAVVDVRAAFASIVAAEARLDAAFSGDKHIRVKVTDDRCPDFKQIEKTVAHMSREAWGCLVERLELRRMMSIRRWRALEMQLESGTLPPITEETVFAFAKKYHDSIDEMHTEAMQEVFDWLRPHDSGYRTNSEMEIGPGVVITGIVSDGILPPGTFRINHHWIQYLTAMENVFSVLDGQGGINKAYRSQIQNAIENAPKGRGASPYFAFKCWKNGNLHLKFQRLDLLAEFNRRAGGLRLKPLIGEDRR